MTQRVQELCRKLQPVLGEKIDRLWRVYLTESDPRGRADLEQTLELLAAKNLGSSYHPDRAPFPPPSQSFARSGDTAVGEVSYGNRTLYPFLLRSVRLKEHLLVAGRSGSGKTNLTFVLMRGIMARGIKVLALDWKRGYRDLLQVQPDLRVYTIGRSVAPFRFNPLIPPPGCEPGTWIKLIVDVIASAYLGGEGVISLLVSGLHHLYRTHGVFEGACTQWPTIIDLLAWLRTVKLKGRAAMWQASAERILAALTYGEFGAVVNTQDSTHVAELLNHNVVLEMDGLSSASDRAMFSEALTLYLYRLRLAQGPQEDLTNLIVLEEAHHILARRATEAKESVLETSIRMIRQYGIGYVFVDQSASLISKVAFANSYATFALSQKLRSDIQVMSGAMNLSDEQRDALSTLPIGSAVVRLADEHPEAFLLRIPRCPIREGVVSDDAIRRQMVAYSARSAVEAAATVERTAITPIPPPDRNKNEKTETTEISHPPSPQESNTRKSVSVPATPDENMSREEVRFLSDVAARPLSTTVSRYQRLHLSRRRGNAIRQSLIRSGLIEAVPIATRSGQIMLCQPTDAGRTACAAFGLEVGNYSRPSLEHRYWAMKTGALFESRGYEVAHEYAVEGNGTVDLLAERPGERVAIEIETGKSDIKENLTKLAGKGFDRVVLVATSAPAISKCEQAIRALDDNGIVELFTWLDVS